MNSELTVSSEVPLRLGQVVGGCMVVGEHWLNGVVQKVILKKLQEVEKI
jgi:hypothetical protein